MTTVNGKFLMGKITETQILTLYRMMVASINQVMKKEKSNSDNAEQRVYQAFNMNNKDEVYNSTSSYVVAQRKIEGIQYVINQVNRIKEGASSIIKSTNSANFEQAFRIICFAGKHFNLDPFKSSSIYHCFLSHQHWI